MKPLVCVIALCIISCTSVCMADAPVTPKEPTALEKQYQADLERIAAAIISLSETKSRLLVDQASGAQPTGFLTRHIDWGNMPFVTVYPVSAPVLTNLKDVGPGRVFGAVRILPESTNPEKASTAKPGVYLLLKFDERWLGVPKEGKPRYGVCLVEVSGDARSGFTYKKALDTYGTADSSPVKITFGEAEGGPTRARARLLYPQEKDMILYEFVVDLVGLIFV